MTGGTASDRGAGNGFVASMPPPKPPGADWDGTKDVVCGGFETLPVDSEDGKSCRRVGSEPAWYLEATAGVLRNAPGTGRIGVWKLIASYQARDILL